MSLYSRVMNLNGQILDNGNVFRSFYTKNGKMVNQTVAPNGAFACVVVGNNNVVEKIINKGVVSKNAYTIDTWNYTKSTGFNRSVAVIKDKMVFMQRLFNKVSEKYVDPNGVVSLFSKSSRTPLSSCNIKLFGTTTIPTSGDIWINSKFYEYFK